MTGKSGETPRRRLLLVSHVFPPLVAGGAPRMGQFAKLLPEFGWDVTILTGRHQASVALDDHAVASMSDSTTIVRAWSPTSAVATRGRASARHGLKALARRAVRTATMSMLFPDREILWVPTALAAGRRAMQAQPCDAVLATHGPATNLLIGRELARSFRLPLIADFRDLWSTLPMDEVFFSRFHRAAARKVERSIVRSASKIIAVAPKMATALAATHGIPEADAISITNGFDPDDPARVVDERPVEPRPFRLVYSGSVHAHYNLDPFWRAVRSLVDRHNLTPDALRLEFVGNLARDDVRRHGLDEFVETRPFVAHNRVFDALARADALLVIETPGYYAEYGYAAKVFDYVLTGKPVVGLVERGGNTFRLLQAAGVGYCAEPNDEDGQRAQLEAVLTLKGAPPRKVDSDAVPFRAFNRRHLVASLADVLDGVVMTEPRGRW